MSYTDAFWFVSETGCLITVGAGSFFCVQRPDHARAALSAIGRVSWGQNNNAISRLTFTDGEIVFQQPEDDIGMGEVSKGVSYEVEKLEAASRIELENDGFANHCLTAWLRRPVGKIVDLNS